MASVFLAEIMLSLYPISVKTINTNLYTQVIMRILTYTIISLFFATIPVSELLNPSYIFISILNLIHIFSSYIAFINMDAGVAMTIFYIYPFFNILFKSILSRTAIKPEVIMYFLLSLIGVAFISLQNITKGTQINSFLYGLFAIVIAALTESLIYTFYKKENKTNPFDGILTLYFFSGIIMLFFAPKFIQIRDNYDNIVKLILFNIMIGLVGHIFRFYGITRVSTEKYSINIFIGVISAYIFGWLFLGEQITMYHIIGTLMILYSIYKVQIY